MSHKSNQTEWLDTLRAIATLGVIIIHVSSPLVNLAYGKNMEYWWLGNIVDSSVRFAVPLFLMLTGTTLLGKDSSLALFYKKRIFRVLLPFIFWILVYICFRWFSLPTKLQPINPRGVINWGFHLFLKEGVSKHFWYIYMILFLYLFVPFMGKALKQLSHTTLLCILLTWVILAFLMRTIPLNLYSWSGDYFSKILGYSLHAGYLVLGFYLSKFKLPNIKIRWGAFLVFLITILISSLFSYYFSKISHKLNLSIYSYLNLNTIIQSTAVYVLIKDYQIKYHYLRVISNSINSYSFGIYLVHILVIGIFFNYGIFWTMAHPLISLPLVTLLTLISSMALIWILCKLPLGKHIAN
jgi:surface polysaccharide O-acyltransferase-like enzyme